MARAKPAAKRLLVVTNEAPWPANHGGRVDQWSRYSGLKDLGWDLALLTWSTRGAEPSDAEIRHMETVFSPTIVVSKPAGLKGALVRLCGLPHRSTHVSARLLSKTTMEEVVVKIGAFGPAAVIVDAIYGYPAGRGVADALGVPIVLRSNNIEHQYMPTQARAADTIVKKVQLALASWRLKSFESKVHRDVAWNFDCSHDDLSFWRSLGISKNSWAPPIFPSLSSNPSQAVDATAEHDLVYLGNLYTPNNVEGIRWLFEEVLKRLRMAGVTPSVLIAGSNPSETVRGLIKQHPNATLIANPLDARQIRRMGRVLVNPILRGSGINVKSVEMLFENATVVTTSIGLQGMSPEVKRAFLVADRAEDFAGAIRQALAVPYELNATRVAAREVFGQRGLAKFASELEGVIASIAVGTEEPREKVDD